MLEVVNHRFPTKALTTPSLSVTSLFAEQIKRVFRQL